MTANGSAHPAIELMEGAQDNGLAIMVAGLIGQNLLDQPGLAQRFAQMAGRVALVAQDAGVALTLHFQRGELRVWNGIVGMPDLTVVTGSDEIVSLSLLETTRFGLPDPRGEHLRKIARALTRDQLRIYGVFRHLPLLLQLSRLLTVH